MKQHKLSPFIILIVILLIGIGYAADLTLIQHVKEYNATTNTVTFKSSLVSGEKIGVAKLLSHQNEYIIYGSHRLVAWYDMEILQEDKAKNIFGNIKTYNKKAKNKEISRNITLKLRSTYYVEVQDYNEVCGVVNTNGTEVYSCNNIPNGTKLEERYAWTEIDKNYDFLMGNYTIGLFSDVLPGDSIEWVPEIYGVEIDEWAVWTDSFNVGLTSYFPMENLTNVINASLNLTPQNGTISFVTGKIGNAGLFEAKSVYVGNSVNDPAINLTINSTMSLWVYRKTSGSMTLFTKGASRYCYTPGGTTYYNCVGWGSSSFNTGTGSANTTTWTMITFSKNDTNLRVYINANLVASPGVSAPSGTAVNLSIGDGTDTADNNFNGTIDEIGFWNRSLSSSEISDLYNSGSGITYIPTAPDYNITTCGAYSDSNVEYVLNNSIETGTSCITFTGNNVTFDMNGYFINDTDAPSSPNSYAIQIAGSNITIYNGTIYNFGTTQGTIYATTISGLNLTNMSFYHTYTGGVAIELSNVDNSIFNDIYTDGVYTAMTLTTGSDNNFINNSIFNNATTDVDLQGTSINNTFMNTEYTTAQESIQAGSELIRKWYLDVQVNYSSNGTAVNSANVTLYNASNVFQSSYLTNSSGKIPRQLLIEYINNGTKKSQAPFTLTTTKTGFDTDNRSISLNTSTQANISIGITVATPITTTLSGSGGSVIYSSQFDVPTSSYLSYFNVSNLTYKDEYLHLYVYTYNSFNESTNVDKVNIMLQKTSVYNLKISQIDTGVYEIKFKIKENAIYDNATISVLQNFEESSNSLEKTVELNLDLTKQGFSGLISSILIVFLNYWPLIMAAFVIFVIIIGVKYNK